MSTNPARELHGRDAELAQIRAELERLSDGAEAVLIVEGAAGMGKSRLLAEVSTIARSLGIRVGSSAADPSETIVELAVLLAALLRRSRAPARRRRAHGSPCALRATLLAAERPATAARARSPGVAAPDLHRRRALGGRRNGSSHSHAAAATRGTADRVGHRPSSPARIDTARRRTRKAETEWRAHDRPRAARRERDRATRDGRARRAARSVDSGAVDGDRR